MKCPHCLENFHDQWQSNYFGIDANYAWTLAYTTCPACERYIVVLLQKDKALPNFVHSRPMVYPKGVSRAPLPPEVPKEYAQDYKEACLVIADSSKASAALSRRCLQNLFRGVAKVKPSDLNKEIDEILSSKQLPTHLAEAVDAIRHVGNFAAHPVKSTNTGAVIDVEAGEAEWLLDVLEGLFDFYFVQPALLQKKKTALNKKLQDAGKPPMK